jgi:hypothetical protein
LENLTKVFEKLNFWRLNSTISHDYETTAKILLNFLVELVIEVIGEIRDKLLVKAFFQYNIASLPK